MRGVEIVKHDGSKEHYDPINEVRVDKLDYVIDHRVHEYRIPMSEVKEINYYDLCEDCHQDLEYCQCY